MRGNVRPLASALPRSEALARRDPEALAEREASIERYGAGSVNPFAAVVRRRPDQVTLEECLAGIKWLQNLLAEQPPEGRDESWLTERNAIMAQALFEEGYTRSELRDAFRLACKDKDLSDKVRFGKNITVADIDDCVQRVRALASATAGERVEGIAKRPIPRSEVNKIIERFPGVEFEDFGVATYTSRDEPLFLYAPHLNKRRRQAASPDQPSQPRGNHP